MRNRRLAGTRRADECNGFAGLGMKGRGIKGRAVAGLVPEINGVELDRYTPTMAVDSNPGAIIHRHGLMLHGIQPACRAQRIGKLAADLRNL